MCKVHKCWENHDFHYCKICDGKDTQHFASNCPQGKVVFHGTTEECEKAITQNGFQKSKDGRLGSGVYFTEDQTCAKKIAKFRAKQRGQRLKVMKCIIHKDEQSSIHPKWDKVTDGSFKEIVVRNQKRIRIIKKGKKCRRARK